jgi:hypothetical protein
MLNIDMYFKDTYVLILNYKAEITSFDEHRASSGCIKALSHLGDLEIEWPLAAKRTSIHSYYVIFCSDSSEYYAKMWRAPKVVVYAAIFGGAGTWVDIVYRNNCPPRSITDHPLVPFSPVIHKIESFRSQICFSPCYLSDLEK